MSNNRGLIPVWQTASINYCSDRPVYFETCSDQGCVGLDVSVKPSDDNPNDISVEVISPKEQTSKLSLTARECCCPFYKPNGISSFQDPCLSEIDKELEKELEFHKKIAHYRRNKDKLHFIKSLQSVWETLRDKESLADLHNGQVSLHQDIVKLLKKVPEPYPAPKSNWLHTGNGMCATGGGKLLHPTGMNMSKLAVMTLRESGVEGEPVFSGCQQQEIKLKGGPILGVSYKQTMGRELCMVRKRNVLHILQLKDDKELENCEPEVVAMLKSKEDLSSASISPHIPSEYAVLSSKGVLELHTFFHNVSIWNSELSSGKEIARPGFEDLWTCDFGSHPRSLLFMDTSRLMAADLRENLKNPVEIFHRKSTYLFEMEQLFTFQQSLTNSFQYYVSTTNHLLICDERFPKVPVQLWKHQLTSFPVLMSQGLYSNSSQNQDNLMVLLSCLRPQETCCFQVLPKSPQPFSLSPPWYCSAPQDSSRILNHHGYSVDEAFAKRAAFPVTGTCSVPHGRGLTIFHQTSIGDLFYQDFFLPSGKEEERTHRYGPGYSPPNAERLSEKVQTWASQVEHPTESQPDFPGLVWNKSSAFMECIVNERPLPENCEFCQPGEEYTTDISENCPSCQQDVHTARTIVHGKDKMDVLVKGEALKDIPSKSDIQWLFHLTDLKRGFDPFTESLLNIWNISEMGKSDRPTILRQDDDDEDDEGNEGKVSFQIPEKILKELEAEPTRTNPRKSSDSVRAVKTLSLEIVDPDFPSLTGDSSRLKRNQDSVSMDCDDEDDDDVIPPTQITEDTSSTVRLKKPLSFMQRKVHVAGF